MGGETETNISGWTVDTLHVYVLSMLREKDLRDSQRFEAQQLALRDALTAQEKAVNAALLAAQTAVAKAEDAAERRFESQNEFREQLGDQARTFLPRLEYDRAHTDLIERVDQMRVAFSEHLSALDAAVGTIGARKSGADATWAYVVVAIGVLVGVAGVVVALIR